MLCYRKVPKFWDARKICCLTYLKFKQRGQTLGYFVNIKDPDQTAPLRAVSSGSALLA